MFIIGRITSKQFRFVGWIQFFAVIGLRSLFHCWLSASLLLETSCILYHASHVPHCSSGRWRASHFKALWLLAHLSDSSWWSSLCLKDLYDYNEAAYITHNIPILRSVTLHLKSSFVVQCNISQVPGSRLWPSWGDYSVYHNKDY